MDPSRHHEFIDSNEERSRAVYFNRGIEDVRAHTQYYPQDRNLMNKKVCVCTSVAGNISCNGCRTSTAEGSWNTERTQGRDDFRNTTDSRSSLRQSPMYAMHSNINNRQYWQQNTASFTEEPMPAIKQMTTPQHIERKLPPNKSLEANYGYKQKIPTQQPQQMVNAIGTYPKERPYDDKYSTKHESIVSSKTGYSTSVSAAPLTLYNIDGHGPSTTMDAMRTTKNDHNIINPSNILASKEQHPSPNYARKCPQIFSSDEQNSTHINLYMSTPQFSSEKFTNIQQTQQKKLRDTSTSHQEYRGSNSTSSSSMHKHLLPESSKMRESSMLMSSPMPVYSSQSKFLQVNEPPIHQQHILQQQPPYSSSSSSGSVSHLRNANYYPQGPSKVHAPEMSPIIMKQTHTPNYQYSTKSPISPPSSSHLVTAKTSMRDMVEYMKKEEDQYDCHGVPTRLYINPYNTPPSSDSCCKEPSSPYTAASIYNAESPQAAYHHKYGSKVIQETMTMNKNSFVNQNTPPTTSIVSGFRDQTKYYYETTSNLKYDGIPHSATSPAVATVASPSPSSMSTSQQLQIQHTTDYVSQQPHHSQSYQQHHQTDIRRSSIKTQEIYVNHHNDPFDRNNVGQQSSKITCINNASKVQPTATQPPPTVQIQTTSVAPKKSQMTKPNYRELINQVYAMRNATSEKELNMQIIKKTLNVDTQVMRAPMGSVLTIAPSTMEKIPRNSSMSSIAGLGAQGITPPPPPSNNVREAYRPAEIVPTPLRALPQVSSVEIQDVRRIIKQEEKPSTSPLDLSMRTVKTKADSTEYKYRRLPANSQSVDCKYALPRVDFTPNFSLHTSERVVLNKPEEHLRLDSNQRNIYATPRLSHHIPSPAYPKLEQPQSSVESPNMTSVASRSILTYESNSQATAVLHVPPTPPVTAQTELQITSNSLVIKTAPKPVILCDLEACQVRPSVLETNPFAIKAIKPEPKLVNRNFLAVDQLPPDTSIMPLSKGSAEKQLHMSEHIRRIDQQQTSPPVKSAYNLACELNPNFLGRKRHLQEYSTTRHTEPVNKQIRYQETLPTTKSEDIRPAEMTVIAVNERVVEMENLRTAEKNMQSKKLSSLFPQNSSIIVANNNNVLLCKEEPVTPTTTELPMVPIAPIKTETNSLIAARIRTKAELKGFTFNPPLIENPTIPIEIIKVKEEPIQNLNTELPSIPDLNEEYSQKSLLDFSWNTTCNDFLEQLLTSSNKKLIKKKPINTFTPESVGEEDVPISTIAKSSTIVASTEVLYNKDDSVDHNISNMESAETNYSFGKIEANDSAIKSISQDTVCTQTAIPKKTNKVDREKMRLQQEKRFAARLQGVSSSESDNDELDKRKRLKKPLLRKGKIKSCKYTDKQRFSDCGSDSSTDADDVINSGSPVKNVINGNESNLKAKLKDPQDRQAFVNRDSKESNHLNKEQIRPKTIVPTQEMSSIQKVERENLKRPINLPNNRIEEIERKKKQVQYNDASDNKNKLDKTVRKPKLHSRVGLNTMTRSKQKRELELQLANSKVLRNDKIIRNSTTKIKRKYVRKFVSNQNSSGKDSLCRGDTNELMSTRLRTKNDKSCSSKTSKSNVVYKIKNPSRNSKEKNDNQKDLSSPTTNRKGKEQQADLFMEVYRFKRSLKVPPSLITMKHPTNHKIAASLPDLERDGDEISSISLNHRKKTAAATLAKLNSPARTDLTLKLQTTLTDEPRSIIDVLHSRVINSSGASNSKIIKTALASKTTMATIKNNNNNSSLNIHSETSQNTESNSVSELLLPTLRKNDDNDDEESNDGGKKRHFSIFDTKVLQSKTRTEFKLQQKREIIREIFVGGDDRPASAPPEITQTLDGGEKMTYEQKYEQFLQQMNIVISEDKLRKLDRTRISAATVLASSLANTMSLNSTAVTTTQVPTIKREEDTESTSALDADEKHDGEIQHEHLSLISSTTPTSFVKRRRPQKYLRRKGSSGFDYIRKKKKPTPALGSAAAAAAAQHSQAAALLKSYRTAEEDDEVKIKTESDVCREIQKWVLNKGVGQSTMHKAARLGYIDVIVYCLDRLNMNPDHKDNAGYTPLHEACTNGWLEIARVLLQYGANHSEAAHSGIRPLHEASENEYDEIVRLLLSYGADPLLATYSGQTPLMLASSTSMRDLLNTHLSDVQSIGPNRKPWRFKGSWDIFDATECGYNIFWGAPNFTCDMSRALRKSSVSSSVANTKQLNQYGETSSKTVMDKCAVVLDNIDRFNSVRLYNDNKPEFLVENSDSEGEIFEFEEADVLLPPLYLLKDEGTDKWVLLSDLCNLLKVKSKDTLLNKIYPSSSVSSGHKSLMRELKMSDFLEKATCLQLLCAGEKINICASKVVLIKYNESVRNLLGVKTILMKF